MCLLEALYQHLYYDEKRKRMTPEIKATVILLILLSVLCATVLSLSSVRKLRPGIPYCTGNFYPSAAKGFEQCLTRG